MKNNRLKLILQLFIDYFKIGLFTFGGGLSMISLIQKTFVEKRKFITDDELVEVTPKSVRLRKVILSKEQRMKKQAKK